MPSREKRARRRRKHSALLPALIGILAITAVLLTAMLVHSDPLGSGKDDRLPFAYPENPNFVEQKNVTAAPLVLGANATPVPANRSPEPTPESGATPNIQPEPTPTAENANRLIPTPAPGDHFLPVFDRALLTENDEMMIAVTVDDCDEPEVMAQVIDIASRYNAKITFFPTGEALMTEGMMEGFKACVRSYGHEIENHSYAHKAEYKLSASELAIQLWKQSVAASYVTGRDLEQHFYRPYNINSAYDQRTHFYARKLGYAGIASYTHSYRDFDTIEDMAKSLGNGKIYQFDMSAESMAYFELFISTASRKGYKLVTMNEMFGLNQDVVKDALTIDTQILITMEDYVPTYYDLKLNYRTNAVFALQTRLIELGYLKSVTGIDIKADGIYGPSTSIAVSLFQADVGIVATGNADIATQERLFAEDAPHAK